MSSFILLGHRVTKQLSVFNFFLSINKKTFALIKQININVHFSVCSLHVQRIRGAGSSVCTVSVKYRTYINIFTPHFSQKLLVPHFRSAKLDAFTSFHCLAPQITDFYGYVLYSKKNATKGKFSFTTENPVMFDVCFLSRSPMGE